MVFYWALLVFSLALDFIGFCWFLLGFFGLLDKTLEMDGHTSLHSITSFCITSIWGP